MSAALVDHELTWLARLPDLPLPIPRPVRAGSPGQGYPWRWSIVPWLPGEDAEATPPRDLDRAAEALGAFLVALHRPSPPDAPANPFRGVPLRNRSEVFHAGLQRLGTSVDHAELGGRWADLVETPDWPGPAVWLHGDTHPRNLLVDEGVLSGVVDFGDLTGGDPASDLAVAWMLFPPAPRQTFRSVLGPTVDEATWRRALGWAFALGVALSNGDDRVRPIGQRTLVAALADSA
jgi:aminoglycoside phosphotransferase (APT) family kinase protein